MLNKYDTEFDFNSGRGLPAASYGVPVCHRQAVRCSESRRLIAVEIPDECFRRAN